MRSRGLSSGEEAARFYEFGPFRIDVVNRFLLRGESILPLSIKAFDLLLALVERHGDVVEKAELMNTVWPGSFVEEGNLSHHVFMLRKQLDDHDADHPYIETIPRRGYRFAVAVVESDDDEDSSEQSPPAVPRRYRRAWLLSIAIAIIVAGLTAIYFTRRTVTPSAGAGIQSIAVLPFGSADKYTGAGLADTLTTRLSAQSGLLVRPMSTVTESMDRKAGAAANGRRLIVDGVVEGRVQRLGDRVRATVRLIRSRDGAIVWSRQFDGDALTPFALEDAIAADVIAASSVGRSSSDRAGLIGSTRNVDAYREYIIGRYYLSQPTREKRKALPNFERAVALDPQFALAHAGIAEAWSALGIWGLAKPQEWLPPAEAAAIRALQLNGNLSEAQAALGAVRIYGYWDWQAGELGFRRALELNPGNVLAQRQLAHCLQLTGRFDEAIAARKRASELDPLSTMTRREAGVTYYMARRYDDAIREHETVLAMNSAFDLSLINIGNAQVQKGNSTRGIEYLERAVAAGDLGRANSMAWLAYAYGRAGRSADAARVRRELTELSRKEFVQPYLLAVAEVGGGDTDRVFELLEQAYRSKSIGLMNLKTEPAWDPIRSDRRFANLLHRMALDR